MHHAAGQRLTLDTAISLARSLTLPATAQCATGLGALTLRDREVLRLVVGGQTDRAIAATLSIRPRTVQDHVSHIIAKLEVDNRTEAAALAIRHGLD